MTLSRFGVSMPEDLLAQFDRLVQDKGYANRSEAVRDMVRQSLVTQEWEEDDPDAERVAVVVMVYDHHRSELSHKLTHAQHEARGSVVVALHYHLDPCNCLEVVLLKGKGRDVLSVGEHLVATKGVKFGRLLKATTGRCLL